MKKTLILLIAVAGLSFAKSYEVKFDAPAVLGPMEVDSGLYKVTVDGSKVTLVNENTHKSFETTATVQTSEKKHSETVVESQINSGKMMVHEIRLGGSAMSLEFRP